MLARSVLLERNKLVTLIAGDWNTPWWRVRELEGGREGTAHRLNFYPEGEELCKKIFNLKILS